MAFTWQMLAPALKRQGYCVFALNHGGPDPDFPVQGTAGGAISAGQVSASLSRVAGEDVAGRPLTHARKPPLRWSA